MNARWNVLHLAALLLLGTGAAHAGTSLRLGTGGDPEARILVGAHSVGLACANLSSVQGVEAMFGNPAGLALGDARTEVLFSQSNWLADMNVNYLAIGQKVGAHGTLGLSAKVLSVGDIIRTTESAPDGTGETFTPTFTTLGLTFAREITDRVAFGGTARLVTESVLQTHANGVSFDFGFQYETGIRGVRLGAAMQNFGPSQLFSGADFDRNLQIPEDDPQAANRTLTTSSAEAELPSLFAGSVSWPLLTGDVRALTLHAVYQSNSFNVDELRLGGELQWHKQVALRAGYKVTTNSADLFGLTYGLGLAVPLGGTKVMVDYAGQTVSNFFDDIQHLGLTFRF